MGGLRDLRRRFDEAYGQWKVGVWFYETSDDWDGRPTPINRVRFLLELTRDCVRWNVARALCARFGHRMVDDGSYAGPECGHEALACTRCGWSWSHVYY